MRSITRSRALCRLHGLVALVVALNYFAFRVELFEDEADAQHRDLPSGVAFAGSSLSWESFDKDNAPQAFSIQVLIGAERSFFIPALPAASLQDLHPFQPVRDKSPPL